VLPSPAELAAERARRVLRLFVDAAWSQIEPCTPLADGLHLALICSYLEAVARGEVRRLLINIPPRHGKTLLVSVMFPAWLWLTAPGTRFLTASYGIDLATRDSLQMRRLVESGWYRAGWPGRVRLVDDQATKARFENRQGGARVSVSVGGPATGEGGDVIILDDPLKIDHAHSATHRQGVVDWFDYTLSTRLNNPRTGAIIVIGQRLHEDDLFGHLIDRGGWTHLCLPAEYEPNHPYRSPDDPRTRPGESLWPEQWPPHALAELKTQLGGYATASMLQQLPAPSSGGIFQRAWWQWYPPAAPPPRFDRILQSWDLAFTDTPTADFVVGQVWGVRGADRYLLRQTRKRLDFTATLAEIRRQTAWVGQHYSRHRAHAIVVERAANAAAVISVLTKEIPSIRAVAVEGDKVNRAHAVCPQIEAGNIYLPGAPNADHTNYDRARTPSWVQGLVDEAAMFPNAAHDDQVDALTQALRHATTVTGRASVSVPRGRLPTIDEILRANTDRPSIADQLNRSYPPVRR
jgi:predicted phage terminase large subunit-like protein